MTPHSWEPCFLLHARSFGDTSIIADIFSESSGKVSIVAKGAKNPRSKFFGHLLPFSALKIMVTGKSEMKTLTQIDSNYLSQSAKGPHDLYTYLYVNELMIRLLPKGLANLELYQLYSTFVDLARSDAINESALRIFELDLLDVLGYGINFETDMNENSEFKDSLVYSYKPERGFYPSSDDFGFTADEIYSIKNRDLVSIDKLKLKQLSQAAITACLDGRELSSREFFKKIKI
ncbi:DNA repair protein RecO [Gammaproteobacteria bacterium]|nr:DNA repair protein RecO [Gammaproteobacteria bacterium]MDA8925332.1 DNA repair protein RecO [Gammaproteobacteria bacterium]MDA9048660.1 DNA repair protein RecO [Gammaproteobacteria bacterium]MDA9341114.1 DNA repair protein RecO [Gammaproteobacteria bacterium]MDA9365188.1 DNA repair protein RecO [Gammaproteobacteria bacterium]|tara:strand:+ start:4244 stop:4942 length:699 start_codon:yes stop_codon:yes gene_type:complete